MDLANTTMEKYVCGAPTKTKRAKPRANLARPAGTETPPDSQRLPAPVFVHQEPLASKDSRDAPCATKANTVETHRITASTVLNLRPPWAPVRPRVCANRECFAAERRHASTAPSWGLALRAKMPASPWQTFAWRSDIIAPARRR